MTLAKTLPDFGFLELIVTYCSCGLPTAKHNKPIGIVCRRRPTGEIYCSAIAGARWWTATDSVATALEIGIREHNRYWATGRY